jgi:hypothetical protein
VGFRIVVYFAASVANLKSAQTLALDDDFAVPQAQFNLANVAAGGINLLGDQSRASKTVGGGRF